MSTMSQSIQAVEDIVLPLSNARRNPGSQVAADLRSLKTPLRLITGLFLSPLFLLVAVLGFLVVLTDFAFFRLQDIRDGHPQPKDLWEF